MNVGLKCPLRPIIRMGDIVPKHSGLASDLADFRHCYDPIGNSALGGTFYTRSRRFCKIPQAMKQAISTFGV
jgi:hypothetical protein